MLGFQTFTSARITLQGIEWMHRIKKSQMRNPQDLSAAEQFYSLAAYSSPQHNPYPFNYICE